MIIIITAGVAKREFTYLLVEMYNRVGRKLFSIISIIIIIG